MKARHFLFSFCAAALFCIATPVLKSDDDVPRVASRTDQSDEDPRQAMLAQSELAQDVLGEQHPDFVARLHALSVSLDPATPAELEQARRQAHESAVALDEFLNGWKTSGEGWKKYLRLADLLQMTGEDSGEPGLEGLAVHLDKLENSSLDAKYRVAFDQPAFREATGALRRYVLLLEPPDGERRRKLLGQVQALVIALQTLGDPESAQAELVVRETADALAASSVPEEAALGDALRTSFLSPNLHVEISSGFVQKFVGAQQREEQGPVREWLDGARIVGTQTTKTNPRVELHSSEDVGSFSLVLTGTSRSTTTAYKSPAQVYGRSYSEFTARKQVWLTDEGLTASPAKVNVYETRNTVTGADVDVFGLFAGIARSKAMEQANAKRPKAEALAARRVRERVSRRLDDEVGEALARLNGRWDEKVAPLLIAHSLTPRYVASGSTAQQLTMQAELLFPGQLGAGNSVPTLPKGALAAVHIHESAVNNALGRIELEGATVEARALSERMREALSPMLDPALLGPEQQEALQGSITFAEHQPLRLHFSDGRIEIVLRAAGFQNGEINVPGKTVVATYELGLSDGHLALQRAGELEIRSPEADSAVVAASFQGFLAAKDAAVNAALRLRLAKMFRESLELPASFTVTKGDGTQVPLALTAVDAQDGWLTIAVR